MDSNGDGIGDLPGILDKLGYIADLGVDAIWVSPFFKSPMKDFGYDISDYRAIDPMFGTMADFDKLVKETHKHGLKLIIDQVLSHTSSSHPWFIESKSSRTNPKASWYVWANPNEEGFEPNNWLSIFGGPAWKWNKTRKQYYLHNFLKSQPDLNYHNPEVQDQMLQETKFWLDRGVDGFRLDAINFCFHDKLLRDNPLKPMEERRGRGFSPTNPYAAQYHIYDNTQPENLVFLERLRDLTDQYNGVALMGEINSEDAIKTIREYTESHRRLHTGYSFELLVDDFSTHHIRYTVEEQERHMAGDWACWAISNHDVPRVLSRWGGIHGTPELAKLYTALSASLRGSVCCYQGQELGLTEATIHPRDMRDPYGIQFWPEFHGRDGCRTPIPWNSAADNAGFSTAKPWLPVPEEHYALAVSEQEDNPESVLTLFKTFMAWRKDQPALLYGDIEFIDTPDGSLAFLRKAPEQTILCCFNFNDEVVILDVPADGTLTSLYGHGFKTASDCDHDIYLPPHGAFFGDLKKP